MTAVATPAHVATQFTKILRDWLTDAQWVEMVKLNRTETFQHGACASHNYCDANEAMMEAFDRLSIPYPNDDTAPESFAIWNEAWEIARKDWDGQS